MKQDHSNVIQRDIQIKFELYDVLKTDFPSLQMPYINIKINLQTLVETATYMLEGFEKLSQNL